MPPLLRRNTPIPLCAIVRSGAAPEKRTLPSSSNFHVEQQRSNSQIQWKFNADIFRSIFNVQQFRRLQRVLPVNLFIRQVDVSAVDWEISACDLTLLL